MNSKITITTDQHKARAKMIIDSLPVEDPHQISIRPYKRNRSAEQNAYMWMIETIIGGYCGYTKEAMHDVHKMEFLVPIFIRDDQEYAEYYQMLCEENDERKKDTLRRFLNNRTSTTQASIAQMSEFLDSIKQQAAELGIRLPAQEY